MGCFDAPPHKIVKERVGSKHSVCLGHVWRFAIFSRQPRQRDSSFCFAPIEVRTQIANHPAKFVLCGQIISAKRIQLMFGFIVLEFSQGFTAVAFFIVLKSPGHGTR
jgi:hypothetical protein